jgi:hypothetical protein
MYCIGPEYKPFHDLRSVPEAGRLRELVKNHGRACTQVLFLLEAQLRFFHFLEIVTGWLVPSTQEGTDGSMLRTCFFRQVPELKIQRKNPGRALQYEVSITTLCP